MLKAENSVGRTPEIAERVTEASPRLRIIRLQLNSLVKGFDSIVIASKPQQSDTETVQIGRLRLAPDRTGYPFDSLVMLLRLQRQLPHQMQCVCMSGVRRQRLLGTELRVEISAGQHVADAGFTEFGKRGSGAC
jgi:hypothetical protein